MALYTVEGTVLTQSVACCLLGTGNVAVVYGTQAYGGNPGAPESGKLAIYNSSGTEIVSPTAFRTDRTVNSLSCDLLENGNFVVAYQASDNDLEVESGEFVIRNSVGGSVVAATEFTAAVASDISVVSLANGNFMIAYKDEDDGDLGKFVIYNNTGSQVGGVTTFSGIENASENKVIRLANNNVAIVYENDFDGKMVVYSQTGSLVASAITFSGGDNISVITDRPILLNDGNIFILYRDDNNGYAQYTIRDDIGAEVKAATIVGAHDVEEASAVLTDDGNVLVSLQDLTVGYNYVYDADGVQLRSKTAMSDIDGSNHIESDSFSGANDVIAFFVSNTVKLAIGEYGKIISYQLKDNQEVITSGEGVSTSSVITTWKGAQTFTPSASYRATAISLSLQGVSSSGLVVCGLHAVDGSSHPTGAALATASFVVDTDAAWLGPVALSSSVSLTANVEYALVIDTPPIDIWWYGDGGIESDDYPGGEPFVDKGAGWVDVSSPNWTDRGFRIFGTLAPPSDIVTFKRLVAFCEDDTMYFEDI